MKLPTRLDKSKLDMAQIAQEVLEAKRLNMKTSEEILKWMKDIEDDLYIFDVKEAGFGDWSEADYAANIRCNNFEPYGVKTKNYVVVHDYV